MSLFGPRCGGVLACVPLLAACGDDPMAVQFQVIEEATFAPSLSVDLSAMERLSTGVYRLDLVAGSGDQVGVGSTPTITLTGWLVDATEFIDGTLTFLVGDLKVPLGLEDGMIGMEVGGTRRIIVPPSRGFGELARPGIPAGSILVYTVTLESVRVDFPSS